MSKQRTNKEDVFQPQRGYTLLRLPTLSMRGNQTVHKSFAIWWWGTFCPYPPVHEKKKYTRYIKINIKLYVSHLWISMKFDMNLNYFALPWHWHFCFFVTCLDNHTHGAPRMILSDFDDPDSPQNLYWSNVVYDQILVITFPSASAVNCVYC